jgi:hypothetical protein
MKKDVQQPEIKNEVTIKDFVSFEAALKPFIDHRAECEKRLLALKEGIKKHEGKRDKLQAKLNELVRNDIESGKVTSDKEILEIKTELDVEKLIVTDLETSAIPGAIEAVKHANADLAKNLETLLIPLREEFVKKMGEALSQAGLIWDEWSVYLDKLIPSLNIQGLPWWTKESFYRLTPTRDKILDRYVSFTSGR